MSTKKIFTLSIITFILYGIFFYEIPIDDTEPKKLFIITENDGNASINIADVVNITSNEETDDANVNIGDVIKIKADEEEAKVNIAGIGNDVESQNFNEKKQISSKAEVSISTHNPLIIRAGEEEISENSVELDGIGIREVYEVNGQDLFINGIKHNIIIKGTSGTVTINGFANVVRIEHAEQIVVNGFTNKVYLADPKMKENLSKEGFLNFTKRWNPKS